MPLRTLPPQSTTATQRTRGFTGFYRFLPNLTGKRFSGDPPESLSSGGRSLNASHRRTPAHFHSAGSRTAGLGPAYTLELRSRRWEPTKHTSQAGVLSGPESRGSPTTWRCADLPSRVSRPNWADRLTTRRFWTGETPLPAGKPAMRNENLHHDGYVKEPGCLSAHPKSSSPPRGGFR